MWYEEDSYSYEEDYSSPYVDYDHQSDLSINQNILDLVDEQGNPRSNSNNVEIASDDDSVAFSNSINESRQFISKHFNIPISAFRNLNVPGLIILRLSDISSIRNETRRNLKVPHILYLSKNDGSHPDLDKIAQILSQ